MVLLACPEKLKMAFLAMMSLNLVVHQVKNQASQRVSKAEILQLGKCHVMELNFSLLWNLTLTLKKNNQEPQIRQMHLMVLIVDELV